MVHASLPLCHSFLFNMIGSTDDTALMAMSKQVMSCPAVAVLCRAMLLPSCSGVPWEAVARGYVAQTLTAAGVAVTGRGVIAVSAMEAIGVAGEGGEERPWGAGACVACM